VVSNVQVLNNSITRQVKPLLNHCWITGIIQSMERQRRSDRRYTGIYEVITEEGPSDSERSIRILRKQRLTVDPAIRKAVTAQMEEPREVGDMNI